MSLRPIYVVAAEYSAPPDAERVVRVFERTWGEAPPPLLPLMENAARRALAVLPRLSARVDHLLVTTMPARGEAGRDLRLPDDAMNLTGLLQRALALPDHCVTRFELGSSPDGTRTPRAFVSWLFEVAGLRRPLTLVILDACSMVRDDTRAPDRTGVVRALLERGVGAVIAPTMTSNINNLIDHAIAILVDGVADLDAVGVAAGELRVDLTVAAAERPHPHRQRGRLRWAHMGELDSGNDARVEDADAVRIEAQSVERDDIDHATAPRAPAR